MFSLIGYDSRSSKWLFVRPSAPISSQQATDWQVSARLDVEGGSSTHVALPFAGTSFGVQLWGPLDFEHIAATVHITVSYYLNSNRSVGGNARPIVVPIVSGRRRAFQPLVHGLAVANAVDRIFSKYDDLGIGGGGFVDCNSCMGEANSHGSFLAGLAAVYGADANTSSATYLSPSQRIVLTAQMGTAVRYLLRLAQVSTGEIRHEFCKNFSRPTESTCRGNFPGYGGPHHSAIALVGLLNMLHSLDSTPFGSIQLELRRLLPSVLRVVNQTRDFLWRGAPLSSVVNGSAGNKPSCMGGNCFSLPYWPELLPSYDWVIYRSCQAWHGATAEVKAACGSTEMLRQLRARAVHSTRDVYKEYNLRHRLRNLTTDEGTFRGVPWFQALHLAHLTALDEEDHSLENEVGGLATAIAQQYYAMNNSFLVLPLMIDSSDTHDTPKFPPNPQGQGLGNAALGMQALDASQLGIIIAHGILQRHVEAEQAPISSMLVKLMERWSNSAISWVQGLSPGVPCSATSWALFNSTQPMDSICAASMVVHARSVSGSAVPFMLPWTKRWWSGGAYCNHSITATGSADTFREAPATMSIINGLGTSNTWTVGFPETYILHDGAYLRGVIAYEQLLDAMQNVGLTLYES